MDKPRPPQTGIQIVDNVLILIWPLLIGLNATFDASTFANLALGLGSLVGALLTALRIYEHLAGETVATTIYESESEREAEA